MKSWTELSDDEYTRIWNRFYADFAFKPDYYERVMPAIAEPDPFVTFDISPQMASHSIDEIDDLLRTAFQAITPTTTLMYWLDWHHTCYRFNPHQIESNRQLNWYPDGDYYILLASDFSFGTFGHPWQQSLCVFGASLLELTEPHLRHLLNVLRESSLPQKGG
jgi:hypothetical protein